MVAEVLRHVLFANVAAALAILIVLAVRRPIRAAFGAEIAYLTWILPLAVGLAALLPARPAASEAARRMLLTGEGATITAVAWGVGAGLGLTLLAIGQSRFLDKARRGDAGPAVVGIFTPRLVLPADYAERFTEAERVLIRAHERAHIERADPRANALMALLQCLFWFNPLVHVAVRNARLDQELACDARVMGRMARDKRLYAQTLLKTQLGALALPLGCHWPAAAPHPLEERVAMLGRREPTLRRSAFGGTLVTLACLSAAVSVWSLQPEGPPEQPREPVKWPVVLYARIALASEP